MCGACDDADWNIFYLVQYLCVLCLLKFKTIPVVLSFFFLHKRNSFSDDAKRINARKSNKRILAFYLNKNYDLNTIIILTAS